MNRIGMDNECDRQTAYVGLVAPSVESIKNTKFDTHGKGSVAVDLSLTHSFGVNP